MRILVIEDDQHISKFLQLGFEELNYQVTACADGYEGYQLANKRKVI